MLTLLTLITLSSSQLLTRSPNNLFNQKFNYSLANFGIPALYQIYGKIHIVTQSNCQLSSINSDDFVLINSISSCSYEDLAFSAQSQGAKLIIFSLDSLVPFYAKNKQKALEVKIVCIGVLKSTYDTISKYQEFTIWSTFRNELNTETKVLIILVLSGNYTLDYEYLKPIIEFNSMSDSENDKLSIQLSYLTPNSKLITNVNKDCFTTKRGDRLCMVSEAGVFGSQKFMNSRLICKYFWSYPNIETFFNSLKSVYQNCEFDYSNECLKRYISFVDYPNQYPITNSYNLAPYYTINNAYFFWPDYFIRGSLLSDSKVESDAGNCQQDCRNSLLLNNICDLSCNSTSCGYDNLACFYTDNCLNFFIGDGNCDGFCTSDIDCQLTECAPGCYYSDMNIDICPSNCTGDCFKNCNQDLYCSPGCPYSSLKKGICPKECSEDCLQKCDSKCAEGCTYSDLNKGICSIYCTDDCFGLCDSSLYCSPGCLFSDLKNGNCSSNCSEECLKSCAQEECSPGCYYSDLKDGKCPSNCSQECLKSCSKKECSPGCYFSDLLNGNCSSTCSKECLNYCVLKECSPKCYYSDLYNGICSPECTQQCLSYCVQKECSPGCYYSDLENGICSGNCSKSCLESCVLEECSPGCYYSDWDKGICSENCTDDCYKNCSSNICSSGCTYSTMEKDECTANCSFKCFKNNCNKKLFCSPGCKYSDWDLGKLSGHCTSGCVTKYNLGCNLVCDSEFKCTQTCTGDCCEKEDSNKKESSVNIVALIVSVITISFL